MQNEKVNNNDIYESKDRQISPFLLVQPEIQFLGTRVENYIIYFQFSPQEKCQQLVNAFLSRQAPMVQPKDLLDAVDTFKMKVIEMKNKNQQMKE